MYEHHLVWWKKTGELISAGLVIHHKNDDKRDNRFSNLKMKTAGAHTGDHNRVPRVELKCPWCSKEFSLLPSKLKCRQKANPSGKVFCSRSCGAKHQHCQ